MHTIIVYFFLAKQLVHSNRQALVWKEPKCTVLLPLEYGRSCLLYDNSWFGLWPSIDYAFVQKVAHWTEKLIDWKISKTKMNWIDTCVKFKLIVSTKIEWINKTYSRCNSCLRKLKFQLIITVWVNLIATTTHIIWFSVLLGYSILSTFS